MFNFRKDFKIINIKISVMHAYKHMQRLTIKRFGACGPYFMNKNQMCW